MLYAASTNSSVATDEMRMLCSGDVTRDFMESKRWWKRGGGRDMRGD
jgi:hypothetical protein